MQGTALMVLIEVVLPFVGILLGLVVLHELGHFVTAKLAGVRVEEFGVGLPPRIGKGRRFRETLYSLNWLPIGGFVRLTGEEASGLRVLRVGKLALFGDHLQAEDRITHVGKKRVTSPEQWAERLREAVAAGDVRMVYDRDAADGSKESFVLTARPNEELQERIGLGMLERLDEQDRDAAGVDMERLAEGQQWSSLAGISVGIDPRSLGAKSRLTRIIILAAGAAVNAILPILLFAVGAMIPDNVSAGPATVTGVIAGAPADRAGIEAGDRIVAVNDEEIVNALDLSRAIQLNLGEEIDLTVERERAAGDLSRQTTLERFDVTVQARLAPQPLEHTVQPGDSVVEIAEKLGVSPSSVIAAWGIEVEELRPGLELSLPGGAVYTTQEGDTMLSIRLEEGIRLASIYAALGLDPLHPPPGTAIVVPQGATGISIADGGSRTVSQGYGFFESFEVAAGQIGDTFVLVRNRVRAWIAGGEPIELSGPVGIARVTGEVVERAGWTRLIELAALISLNLAIINILPLPMLDGGRILFVLIEIARRGKRISPEREGLVHMAGFAALLIFIVVISYFDIIRAISGESVLE